jgi:Tfp pilus assembly protein PilN
MPLINLIHEQRMATRREDRKVAGLMLGFGGSLVLSTLVWGALFLSAQNLDQERIALQAEVDKVKPTIKLIESSEHQYSILSPRLTTLEDAALSTQRWARVLDHVSRSIPTGTWLTQIRCSQAAPTDPVIIELQGIAPDLGASSEVILRLQGSKDLENVNVRYTQEEVMDELRLIKFEVVAGVKGSQIELPKPKEGEEATEGAKS